jgi:nucleoid-associated protein YgaU
VVKVKRPTRLSRWMPGGICNVERTRSRERFGPMPSLGRNSMKSSLSPSPTDVVERRLRELGLALQIVHAQNDRTDANPPPSSRAAEHQSSEGGWK